AMLADLLWSERFWFPDNVTWNDLSADTDFESPSNGPRFAPRPRHLCAAVAFGAVIHLARRFIEHSALEPLGRRLGVAGSSASATPAPPANATLEALYRSAKRRPDSSAMLAAASQLDWPVRRVERWFRQRRNSEKSSTLRKFVESAWFIVYYCVALTCGAAVLLQQPYFWNTRLCWLGWPYLHVTWPVRCYYIGQLGFYLASLYSIFHDVKRKDFFEMLVHHLVTVWLVAFSWCVNFVRIGALVLLLHDMVDPPLHLAKCLGYANKRPACDCVFFVFYIGWFVTRLLLFPIWLIRSASMESWAELGPFGAYWAFNGCLCVLLVLHVVWFYFISRIAWQAVTHGQLQRDTRSESEMSADEACGAQGDHSGKNEKKDR
ncbi:hypothetical protein BOX15_Mlig023378g3, partial [Macrostomum lignano]